MEAKREAGRVSLFFFNDTATTEIYTLSLHDALPISGLDLTSLDWLRARWRGHLLVKGVTTPASAREVVEHGTDRSEEHTSELQSRQYLVCRLLLEKKTTLPLLFLFLSFRLCILLLAP